MSNTTTGDEFRILQPLWDIIKDGREEYLGSPLFPVFMSVTFYFVAVLPFMVIDLYGKEWHWVQKYKIQPSKEVWWLNNQTRLDCPIVQWSSTISGNRIIRARIFDSLVIWPTSNLNTLHDITQQHNSSFQVTWPMVKQTVWVTFWNHVMYILPASIAQWIWQPPLPLNPIAPTLWEYVWQIVVSFAIFDTYYYIVHSAFHKVSIC